MCPQTLGPCHPRRGIFFFLLLGQMKNFRILIQRKVKPSEGAAICWMSNFFYMHSQLALSPGHPTHSAQTLLYFSYVIIGYELGKRLLHTRTHKSAT